MNARLYPPLWFSTPLLLAAFAVSQETSASSTRFDELVTEARVREVVTWIASDERAGRDCPSPGLEETATWLGERFAAAGLEQVVEGSWRHRYTLKGMEIDSRKLTLTVVMAPDDTDGGGKEQRFELRGDADVRIHRPGATSDGNEQPARFAPFEDSRMQQLLQRGAGRAPVLLEIPDDHPEWIAAAGKRQTLSRRLRRSSPVFLIRAGILPQSKPESMQYRAAWVVEEMAEVDVPLANIVGMLRGSESPDEFVVVSAHYDHIGVGRPADGDAIYNGADDDASGTTAVVLLAEALAKLPRPRRSVVFVCFSAEEKGLRGSHEFVADKVLDPTAIVANVNIEMIGRPPEDGQMHAWVTGREYSDFVDVIGPGLSRAGIELVEFGMASRLFSASDNLSFVREGVVAHSISAGSLHKDYHQPSDEVAKLDIPHMTAVIRGIGEAVLDLADREQRVDYNEQGQGIVERIRSRRR